MCQLQGSDVSIAGDVMCQMEKKGRKRDAQRGKETKYVVTEYERNKQREKMNKRDSKGRRKIKVEGSEQKKKSKRKGKGPKIKKWERKKKIK
jgi:hypothetical protein